MTDLNEFMDKIRSEFLDEADDLLNACEESFLKLEGQTERDGELATIFRAIHTIKGSGAAVGFVDLVEFVHGMEDCLAALRTRPDLLTDTVTSLLFTCLDAVRTKVQMLRCATPGPWPTAELVAQLRVMREQLLRRDVPAGASPAPRELHALPAVVATAGFALFEAPSAPEMTAPAATREKCAEKAPPRRESASVKIDAERIDAVLDLVGELVVIKSQLINKTAHYSSDGDLAAVVTLLDKTIRELQDKALAIRLTPLKPLFLKMQRMARDLALKIDRRVTFETAGDDTELDRTVVEVLGDPLMHLVRNAMDHGIEPPEQRTAAGKYPTGTVRLAAEQTGSRVVVRITDDGRGICPEKVYKKALERGILPPGTALGSLSEAQIHALILAPGFSTAEAVTDISGRGVGLDVVRTQIESLKGQLVITSRRGHGTTFEISLPLTASITDGMVVNVGGSPYVIAMDRIRELVKVDPKAIAELGDGRQVLSVRGQILPLLSSQQFLTTTGAIATDDMAVVFSHQDRLYALRVDGVMGQMQVVMKPLDTAFPRETVAGAAILGDGQVALIADVDGIVRCYLGGHLSVATAAPMTAALAA